MGNSTATVVVILTVTPMGKNAKPRNAKVNTKSWPGERGFYSLKTA